MTLNELLILILIFVCVLLGIPMGISYGAEYGLWGKILGGVLGFLWGIVVPALSVYLYAVLVLDPLDRLSQWWRPYPPVCENGCCDSYNDYQNYLIPDEIVKRGNGMAKRGDQCRCGYVYAGGYDFPMRNRRVRVLEDGTIQPYLRHRTFGRWRPDDGKGIVYLTGDEVTKPPVEVPGWVLPVGLALLMGGAGYYVAYIGVESRPHPIAPWFVGSVAVLGFVIGCFAWWRGWCDE